MNVSKLYRKRYYPMECILLKDDRILYHGEHILVTAWRSLHPKKDLATGVSAYFPEEGFKISKFIDHSGDLLLWYCDIISHEPHPDGGTVFTDLLVDVVVRRDGTVRVLDLDEAAQMLAAGIITPAQLSDCLQKTDRLLHIIYDGHFSKITGWINEIEAGLIPAPTVTLTQLLSD